MSANDEQPANGLEENGIEGNTAVSVQKSNSKKRKKTIRRILILLFIVIAISAAVLNFRMQKRQASNANTYTMVPVERRDITETLSGSGTLEPADSYTVTTLNEGEVLAADFEEGGIVDDGTVLYVLDSSDTSANIEKAELALSNAQIVYQRKLKSQDNLMVKSDAAGYVTNIAVEVGDSVTVGQTIATVVDNATMVIILPFLVEDAATFRLGQAAVVTPEGSFETLKGSIAKISGTNTVITGNRIVRQVTIEVSNPGALSNTQTATATIGDTACIESDTFKYKDEATITAPISGDVSMLSVAEGDRVKKEETILTLMSGNVSDEVKTAYNSVREAEISLKNQLDQKDSYTIKSPIRGTVITKNYKMGDNVEAGKTLCTIYDLTYLNVTMSIDELDIENIKAGQLVTVTADAASGKTFEGVVTKVNIMGTTTNGVTTYPVTVRIDKTEGLLPGMNVNAQITIEHRANALAVPAAAVARGNTVLVQTDPEKQEPTDTELPAGLAEVAVTIGASDGDYVEIKEGLLEGDVIAYIEPKAQVRSFAEAFENNRVQRNSANPVVGE